MQGTDEVVISEWRRHKTPPRLLSVFWRQCRPAFRRAALSPKSLWTPSRRPPYTVFLMPQRLRGRRVVGDCARRPFLCHLLFTDYFCIFSPDSYPFSLPHPPPPTHPPLPTLHHAQQVESKAQPHQRVVMYDDQFDSFPAALASSTCAKQLSFAKKTEGQGFARTGTRVEHCNWRKEDRDHKDYRPRKSASGWLQSSTATKMVRDIL